MTTSASETSSQLSAAELQHQLIGVAPSPTQWTNYSHPATAWFRDAGLGLFVHWGIASVHGAVDLSWGMIRETPWNRGSSISRTVTPREYYSLAQGFRPNNYHPERWLAAAKAAGATYAVLTTKHHDGYTLWPTQSSEIGVHTHLEGRDLVAPFVEACRNTGMRIGLYYSPPDWYFGRDYMSFEYQSFAQLENWRRDGGTRPQVQAFDMDHRPYEPQPYPEDFDRRLAKHTRIQIRELLTRYGTIDLLWFDGRPYPLDTEGAIAIEEIRTLQPSLLVNPRLLSGGDFATYECRLPTQPPQGLWEYCDDISDCRPGNGGWGFHEGGVYASAEVVFNKLGQIRDWGGNYLANCGLSSSGDMPTGYYGLMDQLRRSQSRRD